jgi:hypothetical protein
MSAASAALIEGTPNDDKFDFDSGAALLGPVGVYGNGGTDTVDLTVATIVTDGDFAHLHAIHTLALTGASSLTLGAGASNAGIAAVTTGAGATNIDDTVESALYVAASALGATLTLGGEATFVVTGLAQNLAAGDVTGALVVMATGNTAQTFVLGSAADTLVATNGADTIDSGGGPDQFIVAGHSASDTFVYKARSDSLYSAGAFDVITGFADEENGNTFNDVVDLSAVKGITKFQGALASATTEVAADSVAYYYNATLGETLIFANAGAAALSQTSASLMEIELAGGSFKLAAGNFKLA